MMKSLFIDTTIGATIGIIDESNKWLSFERDLTNKPSTNFHSRVFKALENQDIKLTDLHCVFHVAGPGSYTGMRLSEGFCQILAMENINIYSCYHFDIPKEQGVEEFDFISNAFKGEFFHYSFQKGQESRALLKKSDFKAKTQHIYSHEELTEFEVSNTLSVIENNPSLIGELIKRKERKDLYYYRLVEDEFVMKEKTK